MCKAKHGSTNALWHWTNREKVQWKNKQTQINLDCGGIFAQSTYHQVVRSMTDTPATVNKPKQWKRKEKTLKTAEQNTHGLLGAWSLTHSMIIMIGGWGGGSSFRGSGWMVLGGQVQSQLLEQLQNLCESILRGKDMPTRLQLLHQVGLHILHPSFLMCSLSLIML